MRLALLTLESLASAAAVRRFVQARRAEIVLVGLSDPFRAEAGGSFGQTWKRLTGSGPRILPYLVANFALPRLAGTLRLPFAGPDPDGVPLARACRAFAIPCETVSDVNGADFRARLSACGADLIVSFHFDQILRAETIAAVPGGGINVHPGLLPAHRGPVPTLHALLDDPVRFGVSVHRLVPRIDAGALLAQAEMADEPGLTALAAATRLHLAALPLLERVLADLEAGRALETELATAPYRGFPTPAEMRRLARSGRSAADGRDMLAALRVPA